MSSLAPPPAPVPPAYADAPELWRSFGARAGFFETVAEWADRYAFLLVPAAVAAAGLIYARQTRGPSRVLAVGFGLLAAWCGLGLACEVNCACCRFDGMTYWHRGACLGAAGLCLIEAASCWRRCRARQRAVAAVGAVAG